MLTLNSSAKKSLLVLMFGLVSCFAFAQETTIKGQVIDDLGTPILGASVYIEGTTLGTSTDFDGNYVLTTSLTGPVTVIFSYVGFSNVSASLDLTGGTVEQNVTLKEDLLGLDEVVITGNLNPKSKLESSVSVSTIGAKQIEKLPIRTTAELFRSVPGIRAESSGGDGNSNIAVRGIPGAGGSKYVQLQEDGLPVLSFGDIAFATQDIFLRADRNVSRVETIRGGSASTLTTNGPGAIINLISKTGDVEGGSIATTVGLDYESFRTDFEYGTPFGEGLSYHVGGFFRQGEGVRNADFKANLGGQLKANITKKFEKGYIRVNFKSLNDRAVVYMPMPMQVTGSESDPTFETLPGFDALGEGLNSPFMLQNVGLGVENNQRVTDVADGFRSISNAVGAEINFDLGNGWNIDAKGRANFTNGRFVAPFPATFGDAEDILETVTGAPGATARYIGEDSDIDLANIGGNGLAMIVHMFDTELENFNNFTSDVRITKSFDMQDDATLSFTGGIYQSNQNINMSWLWNAFVTDVVSDNLRPLQVTSATGEVVTQNGQYAYGVPFWGNCCQRSYDLKYDLTAPYFAVAYEMGKLNIDGSVRFDNINARGSFASTLQVDNFDVNRNGIIEPIERSVSTVDNLNRLPVNYDFGYVSYSLGANLKFSENQAAFARASRGGTSQADRLIFTPNLFPNGDTNNTADFVNQYELGYKYRWNKGGLFVTGFYSTTTEQAAFQATSQLVEENDFDAIGIELESNFSFGDFNFRGSVTWTDANIKSGPFEGNTPTRQADFIYIGSLDYLPADNPFFAGLSVIGATDSFTKNSNELVQPGYGLFNGYVGLNITSNFNVSIQANNLFDAIGITEVEEANLQNNPNNFVRARPLPGRSLSATAVFTF